MTIAITLKVHEGVVLASDSASTLSAQENGQTIVVNVYDNANKIVNLHKGLPLGILAWGGGSIGPVSLTTIFKDLRCMFAGATKGPGDEDWTLNPDNYSVEDVATKVRKYIFEELYTNEYGGWPDPPGIGMVVAGFSSDGQHAEEYQISMEGTVSPDPHLLRPGAECGMTVGGQQDTIMRMVMGIDSRLGAVLQQHLGVPANQVAQAVGILQQNLQLPVIQDAMPFQDALDLGEFLVDATIKMTRFLPGAPTVGGPIEVAGITKHEGFKWVRRKHYYPASLNPKEQQ